MQCERIKSGISLMPYRTKEDNVKTRDHYLFLLPHVVQSGVIHFDRPYYAAAGLGWLAAGGVHAVYLLEVALEAAEL